MQEKYRAILYHPHFVSDWHTPPKRAGRAAKFSSFKALDGQEGKIAEAGRQTETFRELSEDAMDKLNQSLQYLCENPYSGLAVHLRYFQPDTKKSGGAYLAYTGEFRYYREDTRVLVFADGVEISVEWVAEISL